MATSNEKRLSVVNKYKGILGRNYYDQSKRTYVFKKYKDGRYYSDCSSSICYSYKEAGFDVGNLNSAGMYNSPKFKDVKVSIVKGLITDKSKLRVGDILYFAGTNASRPKCIGHVEMVYAIKGNTVTICGHGSGRPRTIELDAYCRLRYNSKANTPVGNKGLVAVQRYFEDDLTDNKVNPKVKNEWVKRLQAEYNKQGLSNQTVDGFAGPKTLKGCPTLRRGDKGNIVKLLQEQLTKIGYDVNGVDGVYGSGCVEGVKKFQKDNKLEVDGIFGKKSWEKILGLK